MYKQIIILRKDLNMRKGKMVAQGAHASMKAILDLGVVTDNKLQIDLDDRLHYWLTTNFKKITVGVNSEEELLELYNQAKEAGLYCSLITDSGLTEFGGVPTNTAVAIGPDKDSKIDSICSHLQLL